jgi:hypothetical protein
MKQKLVSIYLSDGGSISNFDQHEHLNDYLSDNWTIRSVTPLNGSGGGETSYSAGWIIVILEKP